MKEAFSIQLPASIARRHDWPERLAEFLDAAAARPFVWGETDCCLFVCDAVWAITDVDLAEDFRGAYSSELGATKAMSAYIVNAWNAEIPPAEQLLEEFAAKIAAEHGICGVPVGLAQRGDVVLYELRSHEAAEPRSHEAAELRSSLGVVGMHGTHAFSTGERGMLSIPVSDCKRAWRIG